MNLINNRYRVVRSLTQNRLISSYIVSDTMNNHEILQFNIVNSEVISKKTIDLFIEEFTTLTSIDHPNIVKVFDFGLIYSIDNRKLNNNEYFYTNRYIENPMKFNDFVNEINEHELFDGFFQICKAMNYLHLKGFIYGELNIKNIIINRVDENYNILIKDLFTIELEKQDHWSEEVGQFNYKSPELKKNNHPTISSDIYSIGVFLLALCKIDISESSDFRTKVGMLEECVYNNLIQIAKKMTNQLGRNRYNDIAEIVEDINLLFNKEYEFNNKEELENLNFNTRIIGRNIQIDKIMDAYRNLKNFQASQTIVFVHGEQGIGKTRFLNEINHILSMKKANIYSSLGIENTTSTGNKALGNIIRKIVSQCDEEIIDRYQNELIKFIPELGDRNNIKASEILNGEKSKYRLFSRLASFIYEVIKKTPTLFIIDNAHYLDEFTIDFLEYLNSKSVTQRNILFILSYSDGQPTGSHKFIEFLNKTSDNMNIQLDNLNTQETAIMIKGILSMPIVPISFATIVYSKTYGNPLFIEETLKDCFAKKILYINKIDGKWTTSFDTYEEMQIASTMEQALLNQIKEIDEEGYKVLSTIAIFSGAVSVNIIGEFFSSKDMNLDYYINDLFAKGLLCKKIEDREYVYDFYNKALKNLIYNKLSNEERKRKHEAAAIILENTVDELIDNRAELIYHLEKCNDKNTLGKYLIENANKMEKLRIMDEAILNYKKAFDLLSESLDLNLKVELLFKLGDIYHELGNFSTALENYKIAYEYTIQLNQSVQVDALNKIAKMHFEKNQLEEALKYLEDSEALLSKIDYTEGKLQNKRILIRIYLLKQEYDKVFEICTNSIKLCGDKYIKDKGYFHINVGYMYMQTSRTKEALENYEQAIKYHQDIDFTEGVVIALNNIAVIYGDYYQDIEAAIQYFVRIEEISRNNSIPQMEALALTNLAGSYLLKMDYEISLEYFKKALDKSKILEFEYNIFYCYNYLSYVSLKMGNYGNAYKYYSYVQNELEQYPNQDKENMSVHYQMSAELYYEFKDIDTSYDLITKTLAMICDDDSIQYKDCKILFNFLEIYKAMDLNRVKQAIKSIKTVMNSYITDIHKVNILYDTCILLWEKGYKDEAILFLEENDQKKSFIMPEEVSIKCLYLKGLMKKSNYKFRDLNAALKLSKEIKNRVLQWRICTALGDYYFSKNNYFYAANYYFEACEIIEESILQLPEELRLNYFKINDMIKPFNKIAVMSKKITDDKVLNTNEITISDNKELISLFNHQNFIGILSNKMFINSAKEIYSSILPKGIHDVNDIIMNMSEDSVEVLTTLAKLLSSMVLSTRSLIILDNHDGEYSVIAASDKSYEILEIKLVLKKAKESSSPVLINELHHDKDDMEIAFLPQGIKAIMCIPIVVKAKGYNIHGTNVKGYLYMESERILNNMSEKSLDECMKLTSFISFVIDNYQLKITSSTDKLTGTLTRKFLEDSLTEQIEKATRAGEVFSIVMLDLDNFKGINDEFGHQTGDNVLKEVTRIVMDSIRRKDLCGRYGGEEFIILLPKADTTLAMEIAERVRKNIENKKILGDKRAVTVSMGISNYPSHAKWKQELVDKADQALYKAKGNGKNRCEVWSNELKDNAKDTNKLSGIISGNAIQDSRNVLVLVDLIEQINIEGPRENKIFNLLSKIIEITEAQYGFLFVMKDKVIHEKYGRKIFEENWVECKRYNEKILQSVLDNKQGVCMIDWDEITGYDKVTLIPDWNSVMAVPLINLGTVKGILYFTVSIKSKEFRLQDLNLLNTLGQLAVAML